MKCKACGKTVWFYQKTKPVSVNIADYFTELTGKVYCSYPFRYYTIHENCNMPKYDDNDFVIITLGGDK